MASKYPMDDFEDLNNLGDEYHNGIEEEDEEIERTTTMKKLVSLLLYLVVIVLLAMFIVNFIGQRTIVSGSSMETTLSNGDNLIIDKVSYRFKDPERFDVVVFPDPEKPSVFFIKRIIGLPGETIQIGDDGTIYINGNVLEESYGREIIQDPGQAKEPITLGKDEYFVMGDNRNNSLDSRFTQVGAIKRDEIIGRAICRFYPFNKIKGLIPEED